MVVHNPAKESTSERTDLACSVGIMAYNEAGNIATAIESVLSQTLMHAVISELIVVASGCTDDTVAIVSQLARSDSRIRLIEQERREGKASAINLFLATASSEVLIMTGADVIIKQDSLDALLRPLRDPKVGMVGAHPIPVNDQSSFLGFAVHLLWRLHDRVARESAKLGETVAFRNIVPSIPRDTAVDEISIQALITQLGYRLVYEPRAIVYNRGPATVSDYLSQRRRINSGHLRIRQQQQYAAPTMSLGRVARALMAEHPFAGPRTAWWTLGTVGLEAWARWLGTLDHLRHRPHHLWQIAKTTKDHIAREVNAPTHQSVLVFRIADSHHLELELGPRGIRLLAQQLAQRIQRMLGPHATVTPERNGTIIALMPVDQLEAQQAAAHVIESIQASPVRVNGHADSPPVQLMHGIIAFSPTGKTFPPQGQPTTNSD